MSVWDQKWKRERERWRRRRDECEVSEMEEREREMETGEETRGRGNTREMDSSTLTGIHSGDLPDIPCREVSVELIRLMKH